MTLKRHNSNSQQAAQKWVSHLLRDRETDCRTQIEELAKWAFLCYSLSWESYDVRTWVWPKRKLDDGEPFADHYPWSVLFNRACKLAGAPYQP